jgi:hypothetical protein
MNCKKKKQEKYSKSNMMEDGKIYLPLASDQYSRFQCCCSMVLDNIFFITICGRNNEIQILSYSNLFPSQILISNYWGLVAIPNLKKPQVFTHAQVVNKSSLWVKIQTKKVEESCNPQEWEKYVTGMHAVTWNKGNFMAKNKTSTQNITSCPSCLVNLGDWRTVYNLVMMELLQGGKMEDFSLLGILICIKTFS